MRDMTANPYTADEQRVADFIFSHGIGGGDDPIGFILSSYMYLVHQLQEAKERLVTINQGLEQINSLLPEA